MSIEALGPGALDYLPCRYGASKLVFRGPRRNLERPYFAFVGGTETYGKFLSEPYPALVEQKLGLTCANFGLLNAGVDAFVHDPFVISTSAKAQATVIQVMGAQNMTNRFYTVHPRRNDRFVSASTLLKTIYKEVDFADFNFNKHMLNDLLTISPDRFDIVRSELQQAWLARMRLILGGIKGKTVLLWFAHGGPPDGCTGATGLGHDPLFVTRQMMDEITPMVTTMVEVSASPQAIEAGTEGMFFSEMESMAAKEMLGPIAHAEAADAVVQALDGLM